MCIGTPSNIHEKMHKMVVPTLKLQVTSRAQSQTVCRKRNFSLSGGEFRSSMFSQLINDKLINRMESIKTFLNGLSLY